MQDIVAREAFKFLAENVGTYLKAIGWTVLVVSSPRVQHVPGDLEANYEFVVRFTGGRIE